MLPPQDNTLPLSAHDTAHENGLSKPPSETQTTNASPAPPVDEKVISKKADYAFSVGPEVAGSLEGLNQDCPVEALAKEVCLPDQEMTEQESSEKSQSAQLWNDRVISRMESRASTVDTTMSEARLSSEGSSRICSGLNKNQEMTVLQAAVLNAKVLPFGVRLEAVSPESDSCGESQVSEEVSSVESCYRGHIPTSRQLELQAKKKLEEQKGWKERFKYGAATSQGFQGDSPVLGPQVVSETQAEISTKSTKRAKKGAKATSGSRKQCKTPKGSTSDAASAVDQVSETPLSVSSSNIAAKIEQDLSPVKDQIDQASYLLCQQLINRVYRKAYESSCLVEQLRDVMVDLHKLQFSTITEFTERIITTTFSEQGDEKAKEIFWYTSEQILELGLDCESEQRLIGSDPQPQVAAEEVVAETEAKPELMEVSVQTCPTAPPELSQSDQLKLKEQAMSRLLSPPSSCKSSKPKPSASQDHSTPKRVSKKEAKQAKLTKSGQILKPEAPKLSTEDTQFIQKWIGRLPYTQQASVAQIVMDAGAGTTGPDGTFEFDLANLSYRAGLKVLKFIRSVARPLIRAEKQRERLIARQAAKAERKSARNSQKMKQADLAPTRTTSAIDSSVDERISSLKDLQAQLLPQLSNAPVAAVSTLMQQEPTLVLPESLQEEVFFYREAEERKILQTSTAAGDPNLARQALASSLQAQTEAQSSSSESSEDEEECDKASILGKRTARQAGQSEESSNDLAQLWQAKRAKIN